MRPSLAAVLWLALASSAWGCGDDAPPPADGGTVGPDGGSVDAGRDAAGTDAAFDARTPPPDGGPRDGAIGDGTVPPLDGGAPDASFASCSGRPHGTVETRDCYASPSAPCAATAQTRTCDDGEWSPDWPACDYFVCGPGSYAATWSISRGADVAAGYGVAIDPSDTVFVATGISETLDTDADFYIEAADIATDTRLWSRRQGGSNPDEALAIAADGLGTYAVGYTRSSTIDFGGGALTGSSRDAVIASYAADRTHRWSTRFVSPGDQTAYAIAAGGGRVFVAGSFAGDIDLGDGTLTSAGGRDVFVAAFDTAGVVQWSRRYGGAGDDDAFGIAADATGTLFVSGSFTGNVDFGGGALTNAGATDVFVASYDTDGAHQWSNAYGGTEAEVGRAVAVDTSNRIVVTGETASTLDFGGGALTPAGGVDIFVVGLSDAGVHRWSQLFGRSSADRGRGVAFDSAGNVFVTGESCHSVDFGGGPLDSSGGTAGCPDWFVASFDPSGSHRWSRLFGGLLNDARGRGIAVGDYVVATGDTESQLRVDGHGSGWGGAVVVALTR